MSSRSPSPSVSFQWRASTGRWRWLMLGTLGVAATSCWGEVGEQAPGSTLEQDTQGSAGTSGLDALTTTTTSTTPPVEERARGAECRNPVALGGGWERCDNGLLHRAEVVGECGSSVPRAEGISEEQLRLYYPDWDPSVSERPANAPCVRDSECTERALGHCELGGGQLSGTYCTYGCKTDADCSEGTICVCGELTGSCVSSECSTDADCPEGMCADYEASPGCSYQAFACQTARDECVTNADCGSETCTYDMYGDQGQPRRYCSSAQWVCGRPFLIEGEARLAEHVVRDDWYPASGAEPGSTAPELDGELRAQVAQGWLQQALMEHASVAAFARFSLQLLSLGAPAELVSDAGQALADEIVHARDCFALARRHTEHDVGPAALPLAGALGELELTAIVLNTIVEGCIGETVAALEAAEAHAHCEDAAARTVLARISADETRHAQLAWRFVAWALERGPASLRQDVRAAFERELSAMPAAASAPALSAADQRLLQQGLVGPELRTALRERVLRDVVGPCMHALLEQPPAHNESAPAHASV